MARSLPFFAVALAALLSVESLASAQDAIAWSANLREAQEIAARSGKLILVHFYSDNCPPCRVMERNVFPRPEIAATIHRNFVPVKVHVDSSPQLADRFRVEQWPTDLFLSSAGLEVARKTGAMSPADYATMLNQVAFQAGVGAGRLNENELLAAQGQTPHSDVSLTAATVPMGQTTAPARTGPYDPQAAAAAPQGPQLANPYAAQLASPRYVPTGYTQPAANAANTQAPNTAAFLQAAQARSGGAPPTRPPQTAVPPAAPHASPAPAPAGRSIYDDPVEATVPAPSHSAPQQPVVAPRNNPLPGQAGSIYEPGAQQRQQQQPVRQPNLPPHSSQWPANQPPANQPAPPVAQPAQRASAEFRSQQFVEVSKAPPRAIDGFCPVTILESTKWHMGDVRFGAVHGGRTYLFASAEAQKKFLAEPQRYAPVLSGCDPVVFAETNQFVDGNHNIGLLIGGKTFFFTSEETLQRFKLSPQAYAARAYQAMNAGQLRTR